MIRSILSTLILFSVIQFSIGQQPQGSITNLFEAHHIGDMPYRLLKPISYDSKKSYPVIVSLHGAGGKGSDNIKQVKDSKWLKYLAGEDIRKNYPCYVIAPQSNDLWNETQLGYIKSIIKILPSVDMDRIYVMGQSMGGGGTYVFIDADPSYFAAAIACSGDGSRVTNPAGLVNFNLWTMHGETDTTVPYALDVTLFNTMKALNARMKFTTFFKVGHSCESLMIGINGADSTVTLKNGYKTEFAGPDADPEPNILNWMFSKSTNSNTALVSIKNDNSDLSICFDQTNSMVLWSTTSSIDRLEVFDFAGMVIKEYSTKSVNSIDLSSLKSGMYILRFYQQNLAAFSKKIVKK